MHTDGNGFYACKECHQTESLWNHITIDHKEEEQSEDWRNIDKNSCNSEDGTDQMVQSLMLMMMTMKLRRGVNLQRVLNQKGGMGVSRPPQAGSKFISMRKYRNRTDTSHSFPYMAIVWWLVNRGSERWGASELGVLLVAARSGVTDSKLGLRGK